MATKYLIRKGQVLDSGIKTVDETTIVPYTNMRIDGYVDGKNTVIPTIDKMTQSILTLQNASLNTKWTLVSQTDLLPNSTEFNDAYFTGGIDVKDLGGNDVRLISNPTIPNEMSAANGDAVLVIVASTGIYDSAVFLQPDISQPGAWTISTIKDQVAVDIADMQKQINSKAEVSYVNTQDQSILSQAKAYADNGFLKVENPRIISTGQIYNKNEVDGLLTPITNQQATNTTNIATNTTNIATNSNNIAILTPQQATNTSDIATLKTEVSQNTTNIATNTANISANTNNIGATTTNGSILWRVDQLEKNLSGGGSIVTSVKKYASDLGQPQELGGTATKATFNLASLRNNNECSLPGADPATCNPTFNFSDENIFQIKVRFTIDGQTAPAGNHNMIFNINTGDAEPTIVVFNDRTGANANTGVVIKATLTTAGLLTIQTLSVDGTTPSFSVINYTSMTVNQIQEFVITPASALVTQGDLSTVDSKVNHNIIAIDTANIAIGNKLDTSTFQTYKASNDLAILGKADAQSTANAITAVTTLANNNAHAITTKAPQTAVDNLNGKPVRTIDASGVEIGMSLGAYTTSALDNGIIDKSILNKFKTDNVDVKLNITDFNNFQVTNAAAISAKAPQATTYTKTEVDAAIAASKPKWNDITSTYKTRAWTNNDIGKRVKFTYHDNFRTYIIITQLQTLGGNFIASGIITSNIAATTTFGWASNSDNTNITENTLYIGSTNPTSSTYKIDKFEIEE